MGIGTSLSAALPEFKSKSDELDRRARAEGITLGTANFGGVRTYGDTVRILAYRDADWSRLSAAERARYGSKERWRPIAQYGNSHHNYGAARDFNIIRHVGKTYRQAYDRVIAIARSLGLRANFIANDPNHIQLNVSLDEARRRYEIHSRQRAQTLTFAGLGAAAIFAMLVWPGIKL